jgi:HD-GYP domain-containing protein (c-di-GMP phosphodiesterase class II)
MDTAPFKELFVSLARISRFDLDVRDAQGSLFFPESESTTKATRGDIKALSERVIAAAAFQSVSLPTETLYGVPVENGVGRKAALIAAEQSESISRGADPNQVRTFLNELADLMQEQWFSQKESEEMAAELTQSFEDLHLYSRIATQIKTLQFSSNMLKELIEEILETMRMDLAFAVLPERREYNVFLCKGNGFLEEGAPQRAFVEKLIESVPPNDAYQEKNYFVLNDSHTSICHRDLHADRYRFLAVKMQHKETLYGWLGLVSFNFKEIFRRSELRLLSSMAEQVAVVIANTDLYRDLERFVINVVKSLVHAIEAKDVYTRGHSERVNHHCMMMAERLNLKGQARKDLGWAAILHDVGKIGIPEKILNKPDRLDDQEYEVIKKHPEKGYEILKPIEQLSPALPAILHHHERFDGSGYPVGLRGDGIPLPARIIAVADTFDAITTDRAYRAGVSTERAFEIMADAAGTQLDPELTETFRRSYERNPAILDQERTLQE